MYASWVLVLVLFLLMYRTPLGFRLRALGENPKALVSSGLRTVRYRYLAEIIIGVTCGLAGAFLSVGNLSMFTENMTSGRGYIAVAAVGFSNAYIPVTALAASSSPDQQRGHPAAGRGIPLSAGGYDTLCFHHHHYHHFRIEAIQKELTGSGKERFLW